MDPEQIQSLADENGLPVQHFDGHSVVAHPSGDIVIAHPPGARTPRRVVLPPLEPTTVHASPETSALISRLDAARAATGTPQPGPEAERAARVRQLEQEEADQLARLEGFGGRLPEEERRREVEYREAAAPRVSPSGALPPELAQMTAEATAERARASELSALRGSGVLAREQDARALRGAAAPRSVVTTDAQDQPVQVPASWLAQPSPMEAGLREGARSLLADDQAMRTPAPVTAMGLPETIGSAASTPAAPSAAPITVPSAAPRTRATGGARGAPGPAPMTLPGAIEQIAGTPQARSAFDQTIAGLAEGSPPLRREPDLIDRAQLLDQQRAGLAEREAQTQAQIEAQAEQQRQQLEQDRQAAITQAMRAYQRAIDRVASARIDPSRWFRDQGVAGTVTATIAVALGALGQAFTGSSTNSALDQINGAIDDDIDAQRSEIESGRAAADLQGNMIGIMGQEFQDRAAANDAARAAMLQQAALQVQRMQAQLSDQEARNNADALRAQLAQEAATAQQAAIDRELNRRYQAARIARTEAEAAEAARRASRTGAGGGGPQITSRQLSLYRDIMAARPQTTPEDAALLAGLPPGFVPSQATDQATARARGPVDEALRALESAIPAEGDIPGYGVLDSRLPDWASGDAGRRVRMLARRAITRMLRAESGASITPAEVDEYMGMYGLSSGATEQQMRDGVAAMRRDVDAGLLGAPSTGDEVSREHADVGFTPGPG